MGVDERVRPDTGDDPWVWTKKGKNGAGRKPGTWPLEGWSKRLDEDVVQTSRNGERKKKF